MNDRLSIPALANQIKGFSPSLGGVFGFSDLWNLLGHRSSDRVAKVANRLVREGLLFKIRRGVYATRDADTWILASRLKKNVYISMDSVLARNGLIGTMPARSVSAVYPGPPQTLRTPIAQLRYFKIKKDLMFGTVGMANGVRVADNEKAFLDMLYYRSKGARFVADPIKDVDQWKLDEKKIRRYLKAYKNPKFRKFVEGLLNGPK
ncbi:MAG TPA: hypothetical protein VJR29_03925 [bacterium]|nr:hypothetical protein [bacterium]